MLPPSLWSRSASFNRGTLRVIPVTLSGKTHYVLTLNHVPINDHDNLHTLIHIAQHEWAEMDGAVA